MKMILLFLGIFIAYSTEEIVIPFTLTQSENDLRFYTIPIKFGSMNQRFDVQLDTSSGVTWVPSAKCGTCSYENQYDPSLSSSNDSIEKEVTLYDEDSIVSGYAIFDQLTLGEDNESKAIEKYGFVHIVSYGSKFNDNLQGKLGLGFRRELGNYFSLLHVMQRTNLINSTSFSMLFINETDGQLALGSLKTQSPSYCNVSLFQYESVDMIYREGWICYLSHIIFSEKYPDFYEHILTDNSALFDSAYNYISIPFQHYYAIKERLFDQFLSESCLEFITETSYLKEKYFICEKGTMDIRKLNMTFIIQGFAYTMKSNDLFKQINETHCESLLRINMNEDNNIWLLGYPFVKQFHMTYDYDHSSIYFSERNGTIVDMQSEWNDWVDQEQKHRYKLKEKKTKTTKKTMIILGAVFIGIVMIVIGCMVTRSLRKRRLEDNRPFIYPSN